MDSDIDSPSPRTLASLRPLRAPAGPLPNLSPLRTIERCPVAVVSRCPPRQVDSATTLIASQEQGPRDRLTAAPTLTQTSGLTARSWHGGVRPYPSGSATEK